MNKAIYSKLSGKIAEMYGTRQRFAYALGITPTTLGMKLTGKSQWKPKEIDKICKMLLIPKNEITDYFF